MVYKLMSTPSILFSLTLLVLVSSDPGQCSHNEDCGLLYTCQNSICLHKPLNPIEPLEYLASVLIFLMSALANSTGIGGGEIMVPLLILLFFFDTHTAVPLSLVIMLGGNFIKTVIRIPERFQFIDRPIIDYQLVAFTLAPLLVGATSGFFINRIVPDWLILLWMTGLLFYLTVHISQRALKTFYSSQKKVTEENCTLPDHTDTTKKPLVEPKVFPLKPILLIFTIFVFSLLFVFVRGDKGRDSILGVGYCSNAFWVIIAFRALVLLAVALCGVRVMSKKSQDLVEQNYEFVYDVRWTVKKSLFVVAMGVLAGLGIGVLGIGGSAIINPAMVYVGVHHDVARATVGAAVFLTCSVTLIQYWFAGMVLKSYAFWFFGISLMGASFGSWMITSFVRRVDKRHMPLITLAIILGVTTIVTPTYVISSIVNGISAGNFQYGFKNICNVE